MEIITSERGPVRSLVAVLLAVVTALLVAAPTATATSVPGEGPGDLRTIVGLDYAAGEHPEGLAVAHDGSLYVGMAPIGQLARVETNGRTTPVGAPAFPEGAGYLLGLAVDGQDQVFGAVVRFDGGPSGVWKFDSGTGVWELFAATDPAGFPNGLAFTEDGTLLVSDMTLGTIWAVDEAGHVSSWLHDALLEGGANDAGVNGLAVDRAGDVWFTNSDQATVGKIAADESGSPSRRPTIVAAGFPAQLRRRTRPGRGRQRLGRGVVRQRPAAPGHPSRDRSPDRRPDGRARLHGQRRLRSPARDPAHAVPHELGRRLLPSLGDGDQHSRVGTPPEVPAVHQPRCGHEPSRVPLTRQIFQAR